MRRQLPPSHLKVPPGPLAFPRQQFLGENTVIVNNYSGFEKAIPAIPSLPGFRTSAGMSTVFLEAVGGWSCARLPRLRYAQHSGVWMREVYRIWLTRPQ
jgi:hypothetical protein